MPRGWILRFYGGCLLAAACLFELLAIPVLCWQGLLPPARLELLFEGPWLWGGAAACVRLVGVMALIYFAIPLRRESPWRFFAGAAALFSLSALDTVFWLLFCAA